MKNARSKIPGRTDVAILGGGLAGLTLALQLRQANRELRVTVVERNPHPVPEAAHKVGESTVEIAADYFANVLGLKEHIERDQLRKYGLRFFFHAGRHENLAQASELGAARLLTVPSYQLDRGIFENHLGERARALGVDFIDDARVTGTELAGTDGAMHRVHVERDGEAAVIESRWVVDAMSRASRLRRKLDLVEDNGHHCSAVWFRIDRRIDLGEWSDDADWQDRCSELPRWLSTNHLMGTGYWVWLIPLASGSTSVGIVFDNALHDFDALRSFDGAMAWLAEHQPRCHRAIVEAGGELQDFRYLRHFSHGSRAVYSGQRWALTGEAGVFLDPFYSPGSDFIAISNTYVTDLVLRERAGENIARRARLYERTYFSFYESSLALYRGQYPLFGHFRAMSAKTVWDYAYYWGVLALLFFARRTTDMAFIARHGAELDRLRAVNVEIQAMFRRWAQVEPNHEAPGVLVDQSASPLLVRLNRELTEVEDESDEALGERLGRNADMLHALALQLCAIAPPQARAELRSADDARGIDQDLLAGLPRALVEGPEVAEDALVSSG
ncbi:NAD(P)/FAD-dependent oxidoreductase [Wenzhouxiangella sediminis]|uniref:FAD-dependent oxidoreductase n=1 Tax=Wenzhouxiangella sediminis TaxID=1792836 RepID=A0A3E1K7L1_9GAMM|nr:FAD-dependent oxidoreductase [Wenzhouxiangella sediminis]RFF30020.1 FAD-dependent oxidoreductase [Wenzhouxiangella sediminis]